MLHSDKFDKSMEAQKHMTANRLVYSPQIRMTRVSLYPFSIEYTKETETVSALRVIGIGFYPYCYSVKSSCSLRGTDERVLGPHA